MNIIKELVSELNLQAFQVSNTVELYNEGATVPFISRYRKEKTGSLTETQVRDLLNRYKYFVELQERRNTILESIKSQGKLTPELEKKIKDTKSKLELEDLYLPYKPKRITRGKRAKDAGLEPLARWLVDCKEKDISLEEEAIKYLTEKVKEAGFDTTEKILNGASDIIAEELSDDADIRKWLRELAFRKGSMVSTVKKKFTDKKTKFNMYYDYKEPVSSIPSHRIFAMFRGEREKVLRVELKFPEDIAIEHLCSKLIKHQDSASYGFLKNTAVDSLNRLLSSATETEIRKELREKAEEEAFKVFGENLRTVLLSPPAGQKAVLGVDPGFRTGCKVVAIDNTGKLLDFKAIFPTEPRNDIEGASRVVSEMLKKYSIELIAIGNGTGSRETERFIRSLIADLPEGKRPTCLFCSESGASVYSASEVAVKEFPDQDVTVRGAVSIARRLQDPLSELVKIDPKSIGVGQYQHDVSQTKLKDSLEEGVESCVNLVGVDLNLASEELLKYVSGLNCKIAANIIKHRNENGVFNTRSDLKNVKGLGNKTFEQAAGFLRIRNAKNPLDNSSVHPERYGFVIKMAKILETTVDKFIGNVQLLKSINKNQFVSEEIGLPTIEDILSELEKPGRDPRENFTYAKFSDAVNEISDLSSGMKLEGIVTNVTNFGAFVDIGVHQDGLVHISEIADRYIKDPAKVVKVGQVVKVTVMEIDKELKRVSLSMKSEPGKKVKSNKEKEQGRNRQKPKEVSTNDILGNKPVQDKGGKKFVTAKPKFSVKQFMK